jgi:CRISPR/Cas system CSM-associated protein Csm3 (group 7 of RAMP superfamily)
VLEAETPVVVGAAEPGITEDKVIIRDANGLPYIPATSLAGVLRHGFQTIVSANNLDIQAYFGSNEQGSRLIFSDALFVGDQGRVQEELVPVNELCSFHQTIRKEKLSRRDHVRITDRGIAEKGGKFDEQVLYRGARFKVEIELLGHDGDSLDEMFWKSLLGILQAKTFRLGSGTRKGFGRLKVCLDKSTYRVFDLSSPSDLSDYLKKTASVNDSIPGAQRLDAAERVSSSTLKDYSISLKPTSLLLFGAGHGDADADAVFKREAYIHWQGDRPELKSGAESLGLIPASSIKGALAHRTAFYYNKEMKRFSLPNESNLGPEHRPVSIQIDQDAPLETLLAQRDTLNQEIADLEERKQALETASSEQSQPKAAAHLDAWVGNKNEAVAALFGSANQRDALSGRPGLVFMEDIYFNVSSASQEVRPHVFLDRFTGGAKKHALFQEKAIQPNQPLELSIFVDETRLNRYCEAHRLDEQAILRAFHSALQDLKQGRLPLGAKGSSGYGRMKETSKI